MSHNEIDSEFWADTVEWSADERDMALYLLTCQYRKSEGLFRLRVDQIALDRAWPVERIEHAIALLWKRGWLVTEDGWMLLRKSLRWVKPNQKQRQGAVRVVQNVPRESVIWAEFYRAAEKWQPELAKLLDPPPDPSMTVPPLAPFADAGSATADTPSAVETDNGSRIPPDGPSAVADRPSGTAEPLYSTSTLLTSSSSSRSGGDAGAGGRGRADLPTIRDALVAAGFDRGLVEQSDAAIGLALGELVIPDDVDWHRTGMAILRARESGVLRSDRPDGALRFIAKGLNGFPRLGAGATAGRRGVADPFEQARRFAAEEAAAGGEAVDSTADEIGEAA